MKNYLFIFLFTFIVSTQLFGQDEKRYIKRGDEFYFQDLFDEAAEQYEFAVKANPNSFDANFKAGIAYERGVKPSECLKFFEKAHKLKPDEEEELTYLLARGLHLNHRFDEAIKFYRNAQGDKKVINAYNTRIMDKSRYINADYIGTLIKQCENGKQIVLNPLDVEVQNLGPNINGKYPDYVPVITADESRLVFTTRREGDKDPYTGHHYEEVFYADRDVKSNTWLPAKNIGSNINNSSRNEAAVSLSPDGSVLYIYDEKDLFYCTLKGNDWSKPQPIKEINTKHWETHCTVSADGNTLFFTSDKPGGKGGLDIYVCEKQADGKWSEPKNLGPTVNTEFDEESPFMHTDGVTLYFSSRGHNTMGGYDIFSTLKRADGTWSKPENIGFPINTAGDDVYFVLSPDKKRAYFASAREDSYGDKDIYLINMPQPKILVTVDNKPEPIITVTVVKGTITDERTGVPLEADIEIIDNETGKKVATFKSNSITGKYVVTLPSGKNYGFTVTKPNYTFYSENFDLPAGTKSKEYIKDGKLKGFKVGTKIVLRNIFYDYNKFTLKDQSKTELDRLYNILLEYPNMRIRLLSHTDSDGTNEYNKTLSNNRAKSVVDYLVGKGINVSRLEYSGRGEEEPVDTNDTPEGKQNNRRTEFEVIQ